MLAASSFAQAIQRVPQHGQERQERHGTVEPKLLLVRGHSLGAVDETLADLVLL